MTIPARRAIRMMTAGVLLATTTASHAAPITYLTLLREINAKGFSFNPEMIFVEDTISSSGTGLFDAYLSIGQIPGIAQQTSTIEGDRIVAKGYGTGYHYIQVYNSSGSSKINVQFKIEKAMEFQWFGTLDDFAKLTLVGPGQNLVIEVSEIGKSVEFYEGGPLNPGTYTLQAYCSGSGGSNGWFSKGTFDFTFQVVTPCYADCDQSGSLDIDDFVCFQTLYALQNSIADCDASGTLDIDDFVCFQTLYALGC